MKAIQGEFCPSSGQNSTFTRLHGNLMVIIFAPMWQVKIIHIFSPSFGLNSDTYKGSKFKVWQVKIIHIFLPSFGLNFDEIQSLAVRVNKYVHMIFWRIIEYDGVNWVKQQDEKQKYEGVFLLPDIANG